MSFSRRFQGYAFTVKSSPPFCLEVYLQSRLEIIVILGCTFRAHARIVSIPTLAMNTKAISIQLLQKCSFVGSLSRYPRLGCGREIYICLQGPFNGCRQLCQRNGVAAKLSLIGRVQIVLRK